MDSYEELCHFIRTVSERSRVRHFIMHARKCLLAGLSPAQNRTIPPLRCSSCGLLKLSQSYSNSRQLCSCIWLSAHASILPVAFLCMLASASQHVPLPAARIYCVLCTNSA